MNGKGMSVGAPVVAADRVRWGDVDYARIVRYDAFARFYDLGEAELLRAAGYSMLRVVERFGVLLPRKVLHAEFFAPARLDDLLAVRAWIGHVGSSSLKLEFEITDADSGSPRASAHFVLVCVGRTDLQKRPLPAEVVLLLRPYVTGSSS